MSDGHRFEVELRQCGQELMQNPGIQDAFVDLEMQRIDVQVLAQNRLLTEVDHLITQRTGPGHFNDTQDNLQNYETSMQEQAMPYAVTETEHNIEIDRDKRIVYWLGRTAVEVAMSGYKFHKHHSALARIPYEVSEAERASTQIDDGTARVFVSPRMTIKDAPIDIARSEHLGDDDAIRVSWVKTLEDGSQKRILQSLLVRDIPLSAWVAMLEDPQNIFSKSMHIDDPESALSIMKLHDQLDINIDRLPNGPVSLIEAVIPYIDDAFTRRKVIEQSKKYYADQDVMKREAELKAKEWLSFDKELAESLVVQEATPKIKGFVYSLQHDWSKKDLAVLQRHELPNAGYRMTRELAALLESAQQKILAGRAALTTNPEHVLARLKGDTRELERLRTNEALIVMAQQQGLDHMILVNQQHREMARRNIDGGGGGCPGKNETVFGDGVNPGSLDGEATGEDKKSWKFKRGRCRVDSCSSRPGETMVGPCSICRECQHKFDDGKDPTKDSPQLYEKVKKAQPVAKTSLFSSMEAKSEQFAFAA